MLAHFEDKDISNLLWVYSPATSAGANRSVEWGFPGENFADITAGIIRNDTLSISNYNDLEDLKLPMAMAEYGPTPAESNGTNSANKNFDNNKYITTLTNSYENIASVSYKHPTLPTNYSV